MHPGCVGASIPHTGYTRHWVSRWGMLHPQVPGDQWQAENLGPCASLPDFSREAKIKICTGTPLMFNQGTILL